LFRSDTHELIEWVGREGEGINGEKPMTRVGSTQEGFDEENWRNKKFKQILLEPVQKSLLIQLVEIVQSIPRDKLRKFIIIRADQGDLISCPNNKDIKAYIGDVETLGREGLIALMACYPKTDPVFG
jgi:hypothetical protein